MGRSFDLTYSSIDTVMRKSGLLHDTSPGEPGTLLSCRHEIDRLTTTVLVIESLHGIAVIFLTAFYEIVNVEQQLAFRCLIGREQCEQTFLVRNFLHNLQPTNPQSNLPSTSLVLTQIRRSLFQHATAVVVPSLDESLPVAVLWQICFSLTSCEPVRMHWSDMLCDLSPLLMPSTEVSP